MKLTVVYAGLLALMFVGLSLRTLRLRRTYKVAIGDGGQERLQRAIRAHGNFSEYVPFALLLIFFVESSGVRDGWVHTLALALLLGRIIHAAGLSQVNENPRLRVFGMVLTLTSILCAALLLISRLLAR
jgi:uncharacterized protein